MSNQLYALLAEIDPALLETKPSKGFGLSLRDMLLIIGVSLLLALVLFLWAYLTRKNRQSHASPRTHIAHDDPDREVVRSSSGKVKFRKKRRRHPDYRPRNPSLGETGGLPPLRPEDPAEPRA